MECLYGSLHEIKTQFWDSGLVLLAVAQYIAYSSGLAIYQVGKSVLVQAAWFALYILHAVGSHQTRNIDLPLGP